MNKSFNQLLAGLANNNMGVICCPSPAIGMRQLRPLRTRTYNSIARRSLEMLVKGIQVRLRSNNIADICSPRTTPNLRDEIFVLSYAIRFYDIGILAKLAEGKRLCPTDRALIEKHRRSNEMESHKVITRENGSITPLVKMNSTTEIESFTPKISESSSLFLINLPRQNL